MMWRGLSVLFFSLVLSGCATTQQLDRLSERKFAFPQDTFAYPNELVWEYRIDPATGQMNSHRREPPPQYALHCFVVARSARQFFQSARFDVTCPKVDAPLYRDLIRKVVSKNPRRKPKPNQKIVIPGYANLREFSQAHENLLKAEAGGAWHSYFQRGNWRMVFPFTRPRQAQTAEQLARSLRHGSPPVIHLVRFPQLTINHAMLLFDYVETEKGIQFLGYDPNDPQKPATLQYDHSTRTFVLPRNSYFIGGRLNIYQIYHAWNY